MPSCCSNCRTKYTLLNREAGCSKCALSFCKKCLGYRSIIPTLSDQPMIVCYNCYEKLEAAKMKPDAVITSAPLPSSSRQQNNKNWWGDGLPPPSFRNAYSGQNANFSQNSAENSNQPRPNAQKKSDFPIDDLEERRLKLREDLEPRTEPLSISEIEERLAKLRGCDVELIRNPRSWFHSNEGPEMNADNPAELMKIAEDRARIEGKEEAMEQRDWEELDARRRKVFEGTEGEPENLAIRESVVSGNTEFSEATEEEMNEINNLLVDAEKRVADSRKQEEHDANELRTLMRNTRQKSLDAMQWNEKISQEIGGFWDRQNEKNVKEEMEEEDDEKSLDEETFKKILREAENSEDLKQEPAAKSTTPSPKKKGFFEKLFRKDSKH